MNTFEKMKSTNRTETEMSALAKEMKDWKIEDYNKVLKYSMEQLDGSAIKNLLTIVGINKVRLDPSLLVNCIGFIDFDRVLYYAFAHQESDVIPNLIKHASYWSDFAQIHAVIAMNIAVEMAIKFNAYKKEVLRNLRSMKLRLVNSEYLDDINQAEKVLLKKKYDDPEIAWRLKRNPIADLAEEHRIFATHNYQTEVRSLCDLGQVQIEKITDIELLNYIVMTASLAVTHHTMDLLAELSRRQYQDFSGVLSVVYVQFLIQNEHEKVDYLFNKFSISDETDCFQLPLDIIKNWDHIGRLDKYFRENVDLQLQSGLPLTALFEYHCPALNLIFSRAALIIPDLDDIYQTMLVDRIKLSRIELGLNPDDDPIFNCIELIKNSEKYSALEDTVKKLKLEIDNQGLKDKKLIAQEKAIDSLKTEISEWKQKAKGDEDYQKLNKENEDLNLANTKLRNRNKKLKSKNDELIAEMKQRPNNRQITRNLPEALPMNESKDYSLDAPISDTSKDLVIPVISAAFMDALGKLDKKLQCKAWDAGHGLAASREDVIKATTQIKDIPGFSRIKFNGNYRIIVKYDPGKELELVDIINRKDLDKWINNHKS